MKIYYVAGLPYSDELWHHGIKGQKWGIRRFQNEDGSLTKAGENRYSGTLSNGTKGKGTKTRTRHVSVKTPDSSKAKIRKLAGEKLKNFAGKTDRTVNNTHVQNGFGDIHDFQNAANSIGMDSDAERMWEAIYKDAEKKRNKEYEKKKRLVQGYVNRINPNAPINRIKSDSKKALAFVSSCSKTVLSAIKKVAERVKKYLNSIF